MKVHQTVAGQPIRVIRDFLRHAGRFHFTPELVVERIGVDVTDALIADGLIEPVPPPWGISEEEWQYHLVSDQGHRLASIRLNRRMGRAKANEIVAAFLKRVEEVNADADLLLRVTEVVAFGSFITDAADLGDVDLAVRFERKSYPGQSWAELNFIRARTTGRTLTFQQQLCYGEFEVMRRLKNRSGYLALHWIEELEQLDCPQQRIFPQASTPVPDPRSSQRRRRLRARPAARQRRGDRVQSRRKAAPVRRAARRCETLKTSTRR